MITPAPSDPHNLNAVTGADKVVFVPGIMGSALRYDGPGPLGNRIDEYIWSEDMTDILSEDKLERLVYPTKEGSVRGDYVLGETTVYGIPFLGQDVYGPLLRYLYQVAKFNGAEFINFPYDWRASNSENATLLTRKLLDEDRRASEPAIVLVTHSMGGFVCQLALANSEELRKRVRLRIHISPPFRGSTKAFWTLKVSPALSPPLDRLLWSLLHTWDLQKVIRGQPTFFDQFMQAIRTFPSIYELLPPEDIAPLVTETGNRISCVDERVWQQTYRHLVENAKAVHHQLAASPELRIPTFVIYSASYSTDQTYLIRNSPLYSARIRRVEDNVKGDGTVTVDSAIHNSSLGARYIEKHGPNNHVSICRNPATLAKMTEQIWNPVSN